MLWLPSLGAQGASVPNTGIYREAPPPAVSIAQQQAAIDAARAAQPDRVLLERVQLTNLGELARIDFQGHQLTDVAAEAAGDRILYAPSEADDPAWRASLALAAGGATVDYYDTRVGTPNVALLSTYDAVYTWVNYAYLNNVLFGDNLAAYNDLGGNVVLGVFCTYTSGNFLSGAIMTPAYCPVVSPLGTNHFATDAYAGDGVTCLYNGVSFLDSYYRDFLALQGAGVLDGTYGDGEICHAYRPYPGGGAGDVVYSNGAGASPLFGGGDWDDAVANASLCKVGVPSGLSILYAPSDPDDPTYRAQIAAAAGGASVSYFDARAATPTLAQLLPYDVVYTWVNYAYFDNVGMGNVLADYVDQGGNVVLGAFCTYTSGYYLAGRVMTSAYSPVWSPTGTNHYSFANYAGDGVTCLYNGVSTALGCQFRDVLSLQGGGTFDGLYADGEICHAYQTARPVPGAGTIVYSNGVGRSTFVSSGLATGEWGRATANSGTCITYGSQFQRNAVGLPKNAWAWIPDPVGPPSVSRAVWMPRFEGTAMPLGPWNPALGMGSVFFSGLFLGPSVPDLFVGGTDPWVLGSLLPPNPIATLGPIMANPGLTPVPYPIPPNPALIGVSATTQVVVFDLFKPIPYRLTNAIDFVIGT
jgi:hypothetical protein